MTKSLILVWALLATLSNNVRAVELPLLLRMTKKYFQMPVDSPLRPGLMRRMIQLGYVYDDEDICPQFLTDIHVVPVESIPTTPPSVELVDIYGLELFGELREALLGADGRGGFTDPSALNLRSKGLRSVLELLRSGQLGALGLTEQMRTLILDVVYHSANGVLLSLVRVTEDGQTNPFLSLEQALKTNQYPIGNQKLRFELWTALYAGAGKEMFFMFPQHFAQGLTSLVDAKNASGLRSVLQQFGPVLYREVSEVSDPHGIYAQILQKMSSDHR